MTNTSATGGYLAPTGTVATDGAFEDQIQAAIVGITALPGDMVRPSWQPNPPQKPDLNVDWCAYRVESTEPNWTGAIIHHPEGQGTDELRRHETVNLLVSFYGPHSEGYAGRLRDGMLIPQNMEAFKAQGLAFLEAGRLMNAPEYVNNQWVTRRDLTVKLRRVVIRTYDVLNVLSAEGEIVADTGPANNWNTENT